MERPYHPSLATSGRESKSQASFQDQVAPQKVLDKPCFLGGLMPDGINHQTKHAAMNYLVSVEAAHLMMVALAATQTRTVAGVVADR